MALDPQVVTPTPVKKSRWPTRKWWVTALVLVAGVLTSGIDSGFDDAEAKMAIGVVVTLGTAYAFPNAKGTPEGDGVPAAS